MYEMSAFKSCIEICFTSFSVFFVFVAFFGVPK